MKLHIRVCTHMLYWVAFLELQAFGDGTLFGGGSLGPLPMGYGLASPSAWGPTVSGAGSSQQAAPEVLLAHQQAALQWQAAQLERSLLQGREAAEGQLAAQLPPEFAASKAEAAELNANVRAPNGAEQPCQCQDDLGSTSGQAPNGPAVDLVARPAPTQGAVHSFVGAHGGWLPTTAVACQVSKVTVRQDYQSSSGLSMTDVTALYVGSNGISEIQHRSVPVALVSTVSFMCMDDRVVDPSLVTPGGDLGEFILALAAHLQDAQPTQQVVDAYLLRYAQMIPSSRPLVHCTDDRAITHLEAELPVENLDIQSPPEHVKQAGLLDKLTQVENQGDSHIRLMLKQPEWFQLHNLLVPMVLRSFYSLLWRQSQDPSNPLYRAPKLKLKVLSGESNPQAFLEVTSSELCHGRGYAPLLSPREGGHAVLVSHLEAVSFRRGELASFFSTMGGTRRMDPERMRQRLDRHGWLALETTGSRIAAGLPFYTLTYT